jgi:mRNA interferase HigB
MVIISYSKLRQFYQKHPDAEDALNNWYYLAENADWSNFHQVKSMFNSVDAVGNDRYVFNIRGNTYRIVAMIKFKARTVYIRFVGTHAEYNKITASEI